MKCFAEIGTEWHVNSQSEKLADEQLYFEGLEVIYMFSCANKDDWTASDHDTESKRNNSLSNVYCTHV